MGTSMTDFFIYKWRYVLGYSLVGFVLIELLVLALFFVPGGLSADEMSTTVVSNNISPASFVPASVINLPYHVLQHGSFKLLGVTTLSIKLPSFLLGLLSIAGMILLLRAWFRQNVAILTTILVVTTSGFLFAAQNGTPDILYIFWSVWILVAATLVSQKAAYGWLWKIILFVFAALSLYTPLSLYILIALLSAAVFHPHLRFIVRRLPKLRLAVAIFVALLVLAPLLWSLVRQPAIVSTLLGLPQSPPNFIGNLRQLASEFFGFMTPGSQAGMLTPVFSLPAMLLILLGVYRLITTKYTARSYIIVSWIILLIPALLLSPAMVNAAFIPSMLLMAMGIDDLFRRWYRLFPRNPYARVAGLIPLSVLMAIMVVSGVERYAYGYHYTPAVAGQFSSDLQLLTSVQRQPAEPATIVAAGSELDFYRTVASRQKNMSVVPAAAALPAAPLVIVTAKAYQESSYGIPVQIVTNAKSQDASRFYVYKSSRK